MAIVAFFAIPRDPKQGETPNFLDHSRTDQYAPLCCTLNSSKQRESRLAQGLAAYTSRSKVAGIASPRRCHARHVEKPDRAGAIGGDDAARGRDHALKGRVASMCDQAAEAVQI